MSNHVLHVVGHDDPDDPLLRLECVRPVGVWVECETPGCPAVDHVPDECLTCRCHEADECTADDPEACHRLSHHDTVCCCSGGLDPVEYHGVEHQHLDGWMVLSPVCVCRHPWLWLEVEDSARDLTGGREVGWSVPVSIEWDDVWCLEAS